MRNMKFWRTALVATLVLTVMLSVTGGTIAWFTDNVTSASNVIKAGNLDIELEYSFDGANWTPVTETTEIFDKDALWEPGHVQRVAFRISNKGNLALKYTLKAKILEEASSTNVYGEAFRLSDYLEVGHAFVQAADGFGPVMIQQLMGLDRDAFTAGLVNVGFDGAVGQLDQELQPGVGHVTALAIYMPTSVGNEANHMTGVAAPSITFGIELEATQYTYEEDSFDKQYDKDAPQWTGASDTTWYTGADASVTEYTLDSAEDLAGLAELVNAGTTSFDGKTIKLDANLDLGGKEWPGIGTWDYVFEGDFDGQGHTVSNLYFNDSNADSLGLFSVVNNAVIKNITVENVEITGNEMVAAIVASPYSNCTISNCHVKGDIKLVANTHAAGIATYTVGNMLIENCSVIADDGSYIKTTTKNAAAGICAWQLGAGNVISNCRVENIEITGYANVSAIAAHINGNNEISNCYAKNVILNKTREDGRASIGLAAGSWTNNTATKTIKNNVFENIVLNGTVATFEASDVMCGSGYDATDTNVESVVITGNTMTNITNNLTVK